MGKTVWLGVFHRETEWNQTFVDKVKVSGELATTLPLNFCLS